MRLVSLLESAHFLDSFLPEGIASLVNNQPDMVLVDQASNGAEAIKLFRKHPDEQAIKSNLNP